MSSVKSMIFATATLLLLGACGNGDLSPSNTDLRPQVTPGTAGYQPSQLAIDFTLSDSLGNPFTLSDHFTGGAQPANAIVLYFTMWCPICTSHMDHMLFNVVPSFATRGNTAYIIVDYVSGSVAGTRASELANGYGGSAFTVLSDSNQTLFNLVNASMGTTVVIDGTGTVLMNEDYRGGANLTQTLNGVLP